MTSRVSSTDRASQSVSDQISPDDAMWDGNPSHYFGVGQSALRCIKVAMLAAGIETFANILDLPCGHGRVLRHLQHAFPGARLTACDINVPGTEFCARTFGATPVQGNESPGKIALQGNYDLIWVGSLLTHLDAKTCADFLDVFRVNLCPNGLLVCTIHGRKVADRMRSGIDTYGLDPKAIADILEQYSQKEFAFCSYPLNHPEVPGISADYGISITSPCWVFNQVARMPDVRLLNYTEKGWDNHHDVVSLLRESVSGEESELGRFDGSLDRVEAASAGGWAWDRTQPNVPIKVNVYDGTKLLASITAAEFREDLKSDGKGDGKHAFNYALPQTLRDGQSHTISVKFGDTTRELPGSPKTLVFPKS